MLPAALVLCPDPARQLPLGSEDQAERVLGRARIMQPACGAQGYAAADKSDQAVVSGRERLDNPDPGQPRDRLVAERMVIRHGEEHHVTEVIRAGRVSGEHLHRQAAVGKTAQIAESIADALPWHQSPCVHGAATPFIRRLQRQHSRSDSLAADQRRLGGWERLAGSGEIWGRGTWFSSGSPDVLLKGGTALA